MGLPFFHENFLFFVIENGKILCWNYKLHEQFLLDIDYFLELLNLSQTKQFRDEKIGKELLDANLVTRTPSEPTNWGWDLISQIFHIGTQNVSSIKTDNSQELAKEYLEKCDELNKTIPPLFLEKEGKIIDLPEPDISVLENISFFSSLKSRKTCRAFNSELISLKELSLILYCSFGLIHGDFEEFKKYDLIETAIRKASPSNGGLHSDEAYLVVYRVEHLEEGLYHYRPRDHKLTLLNIGDHEDRVININYNQYFSKGMSFGIYITSRLDKIWWKYKHSRSYKVTLLDIGHVSQTFLLCSSALGFQTWLTSAFQDSEVENFLGIDGSREIPILYVGCGKGNNQAIPKNILDQLNS